MSGSLSFCKELESVRAKRTALEASGRRRAAEWEERLFDRREKPLLRAL
jgi:hypothetical protein